MRRNSVLLVLCLLLARNGLPAQSPSLYFEKITTENGLSHNKVNCILQDKRGFIWLGTDDGLNRYDGNHFVLFRHLPDDASSISGNIIKDIVEDEDSVLWIATADGGLTRYDYRLRPGKQFRQYKHLTGDSNSIPVNIVNTLLLDQYGFLWLGTSGHTVLRFNRKTEIFEEPVRTGTKTVLDLCLDSTGMIWAGKAGGGLLRINPSNLDYQLDQRYNDLYAKLPHSTVTALYADKERNIWFGSWDKILYRQSGAGEERFQQNGFPFSFNNDEIDCFTEDAQGRIWMGGRYSGLHLYDKRSENFYNYEHDPSREGTVAGNTVNCLYTDRNGTIWVGTNKGVSIHYPLQQQFTQLFLPRDKEAGNIIIYDFFTDSRDDLWIGTSEGIYIRKATDHSFVHRPVSYKGNKLSVTKFFKDTDGSFYIGTNYSLFRYDTGSNKIFLLPGTEKDPVMNKIIDSRVVSVVRDSIEGRPVLLVSPYGHFLAYYDLQQNQWVSRLDTVKKILERFNLKDNLIRKIYKTHSGQLWLATAKLGLGNWKKGNPPRVDHLCNNPAVAGTISNDDVYDIAEEASGNLWVSTYGGGLQYFNTRTRQFNHIAASNNLLEGLQTDAIGRVWMISNGNLHRYDPLRRSYASFQLPDIDKSGGVKGYLYKDDRGFMYAAGINYFIEFDPAMVHHERRSPQVFLTDFKVFNQSFSHLLQKKEIELPYDHNYFTIEFAAPDFSGAQEVQYAYMLEGRDKEWINLGNRNFEQFSNLNGGKYVFKVRATNQSGLWNENLASVSIEIIPPLWKRWWFYALCGALAALIVYFVYRYRINELLKRQAIRNKIAQDLHDNIGSTLSSISVYSQVAKIYNEQQKTTDLQSTLEKISSASSEMIAEMSDTVWSINPRHDNIDTILQRMESYAGPLLASQDIHFHFEPDPSIKQIQLEMTRRKNFYLIFKESVNNALKYSGCKNLWVKTAIRQHQLELTVKDDGVGFDPQQVQILALKSLAGNGLWNMERRAAEMKGKLTVTSAPGQGTTVHLIFPIT